MSQWFERHIQRTPQPLPPDATRDSLLRAIIDAPDDDAPRWVYSDWLLERGDPRGEFIAVQLTLAPLPTGDERRDELLTRETELLDKHKKDWVGDFKGRRTEYGVEGERTWVRGAPTHWTFARGFVDTVTMAAMDFAANAQELLSREPVRRVHLTNADHDLPAFVEACPGLERVRELDLSRNSLRDGALDALLGSGRWERLEVLDLYLCRLGVKRAVATLPRAEAAKFPRLRALRLIDNRIGDKGVAALLEASVIPQLRELRLGRNQIKKDGALALARAPGLDGLEWLDLRLNPIEPTEQALLIQRFDGRVTV